MSDLCIYSLSFMNKIKDLNISKSCPDNITKLEIKFEKIDHVILPTRQKFSKFKKNNRRNESLWKSNLNLLPVDIKKITSILNKLTEENYGLMLKETKTFNYSDPEIVTKIFKKVLREPFFSKIYSKFCKDLENLHPLLKDMYMKEFKENKHKNLAIFIGELYNIGLIDDLSEFLYELESDLTEKNIEILCTLIKTVGIHNVEFFEIINKLKEIKDKLSPRFKFMILDIIELL